MPGRVNAPAISFGPCAPTPVDPIPLLGIRADDVLEGPVHAGHVPRQQLWVPGILHLEVQGRPGPYLVGKPVGLAKKRDGDDRGPGAGGQAGRGRARRCRLREEGNEDRFLARSILIEEDPHGLALAQRPQDTRAPPRRGLPPASPIPNASDEPSLRGRGSETRGALRTPELPHALRQWHRVPRSPGARSAE